MMKHVQPLAIALLLCCALPVAAQTPCLLGDDGFNVGCCAPVMPNLPQFPNITTDATYGCLFNCNLEAQYTNNVSLSFQWVLCDYAVMQVSVTPASAGAPAFGGQLFAKYSRTWQRVTPTGVPAQVWRFLVNGDLLYQPTSLGGFPCPNPPETASGRPVHMVGSVDYICDPFATGALGFRVEMNLNHLNGCISHASWTSAPIPGPLGHPDRSYHLVAPSNFSFAPVPEPNGPMAAEAVRSSNFNWLPFNYQCRGESRVVQGSINTLSQGCYSCSPISSLVNRYAHQRIQGTTVCNGITKTFTTIPVGTIAPGGLVTLKLGSYLPTPVSPPGAELCIHWGFMYYQPDCTQQIPIHVVTGVTTSDAFAPGVLFPAPGTVPLPPQRSFMDLQNVLILPVTAATYGLGPHIGWGSLFIADTVWNLNLP